MVYIRHEQGKRAEALACRYLQAQKIQLLQRNFRCRLGEIDLIMRDSCTLLFIEVRYRNQQTYGGAAASITRKKQQRIIRTAHYYLQKYPLALPARFDVVTVDKKNKNTAKIQWIQHAFQI